jgi:hypothetical protein
MKITSDLTNLTTAILVLTVQMFIKWTLIPIEIYLFIYERLQNHGLLNLNCAALITAVTN